jgi:hypothetical protein
VPLESTDRLFLKSSIDVRVVTVNYLLKPAADRLLNIVLENLIKGLEGVTRDPARETKLDYLSVSTMAIPRSISQ